MTSAEQATLNLMIDIPEPYEPKGRGKDRQKKQGGWNKPLNLHPRISRGLSDAEWAKYQRDIENGMYQLHRELVGRGLYKTKHKPKSGRPFSNPFMTARAIGTKAAAIV